MDGDSGGAAVRVEEAAGAQGAAEQETAGAAETVTGGGAGGSEAAERTCTEYEAALSERDRRIEELQGEIAGAAKTTESAEKLRAEMDELRRQGNAQRVSFELQLAGARNVKAATALLGDYEGDVEKLRAAEPWLFSDAAAPQPKGVTGLPNAGAASDEGKTVRRWREIAGLPTDKDGEQ